MKSVKIVLGVCAIVGATFLVSCTDSSTTGSKLNEAIEKGKESINAVEADVDTTKTTEDLKNLTK